MQANINKNKGLAGATAPSICTLRLRFFGQLPCGWRIAMRRKGDKEKVKAGGVQPATKEAGKVCIKEPPKPKVLRRLLIHTKTADRGNLSAVHSEKNQSTHPSRAEG